MPLHPRQSDIAAAATRLANACGYNPNGTYFVYTPTGHSQSGFGTRWCAYHSSTTISAGVLPYAYMPYQPDAGASCGENFVNQTNDGWLDSGGSETGDKCACSAASTNVTLGSNFYAVQPLWSNSASGCVISGWCRE